MSVLIMILLLSILILVHEAGHYFAARAFGMKVQKFGFGMPIGPTLFEKQVGDLTIVVHAFLLGGYVSFPDDEPETTLPKDSMDRFSNRPIYQRMIVISAGVVANIICAFVLVLLTAFLWGNIPSTKYDIYINKIVAEEGASVWSSNLQAGDKIIEINGLEATNSSALTKMAQLSKKYDGKVAIDFVEQNYNAIKEINPAFTHDEIIPQDLVIRIPATDLEAPITLTKNQVLGLDKIVDNKVELSKKQIELRDKLINKTTYISDGETTLDDIANAISDTAMNLNLKVLRNGEEIELLPIQPDEDGTIGVEFSIKEVLMPVTSVKTAFSASTKYLVDQTGLLFYGLKQIFTGNVSPKDLHGVVAITKIGGDIIDQSSDGIFYGLLLTAIISMDLAIINFLPIPALDGGHFVFLILEKIRGKKLNEKTVNFIGNACFMALIVLMVLVVFNDIYALVMHQI
ncbi:MAG: RIP metalloprotease RseP [Candidatus Gastranaerophilales bacterium]